MSQCVYCFSRWSPDNVWINEINDSVGREENNCHARSPSLDLSHTHTDTHLHMLLLLLLMSSIEFHQFVISILTYNNCTCWPHKDTPNTPSPHLVLLVTPKMIPRLHSKRPQKVLGAVLLLLMVWEHFPHFYSVSVTHSLCICNFSPSTIWLISYLINTLVRTHQRPHF